MGSRQRFHSSLLVLNIPFKNGICLCFLTLKACFLSLIRLKNEFITTNYLQHSLFLCKWKALSWIEENICSTQEMKKKRIKISKASRIFSCCHTTPLSPPTQSSKLLLWWWWLNFEQMLTQIELSLSMPFHFVTQWANKSISNICEGFKSYE